MTPGLESALRADRPLIFGALEINLPGYDLRLLDGSGEVMIGGNKFVGRDATFGTIASVKAENLTQRQLRMASRIAAMNGIEVASDIDAVLGLGGEGGDAELYDLAVQIVAKDRKCSTSYIQRKLAIGYNKAARLVEQMEEQGVVSPANHVGKREVLVPEV